LLYPVNPESIAVVQTGLNMEWMIRFLTLLEPEAIRESSNII